MKRRNFFTFFLALLCIRPKAHSREFKSSMEEMLKALRAYYRENDLRGHLLTKIRPEVEPDEASVFETVERRIIFKNPRGMLVLEISGGKVISPESYLGMSEMEARCAATSVMRWRDPAIGDNEYPEMTIRDVRKRFSGGRLLSELQCEQIAGIPEAGDFDVESNFEI